MKAATTALCFILDNQDEKSTKQQRKKNALYEFLHGFLTKMKIKYFTKLK